MGEHRLSKAVTIASLSLVMFVAGCDVSSGSGSGGPTPTGRPAAGPVLSSSPPAILGHGISPSLAVSQDSATVAWVRGYTGRPVRVRSQASTGSWGPVKTLGVSDLPPAAAANRDGTTVMVWEQRQAGGYRFMVSRRPAHGSWQDAVALYRVPSPRAVTELHVALSDNGASAIWWVEGIVKDDPPPEVVLRLLRGTLRDLAVTASRGVQHLDSAGHYRRVRQPRGPDRRLCHQRRDLADTTQQSRLDSTSMHRGLQRSPADVAPRMMTPRGDTLAAAWQDGRGFAARRRTKGRWKPPMQVKQSTGSDVDWHFDAAMDDRGNTTVGWLTLEGQRLRQGVAERRTGGCGTTVARAASRALRLSRRPGRRGIRRRRRHRHQFRDRPAQRLTRPAHVVPAEKRSMGSTARLAETRR